MGQIFNNTRRTILALVLLAVIGIDTHLVVIIKQHFDVLPTTKDWFCLEGMAIITEIGIGVVWFSLTNRRL